MGRDQPKISPTKAQLAVWISETALQQLRMCAAGADRKLGEAVEEAVLAWVETHRDGALQTLTKEVQGDADNT